MSRQEARARREEKAARIAERKIAEVREKIMTAAHARPTGARPMAEDTPAMRAAYEAEGGSCSTYDAFRASVAAGRTARGHVPYRDRYGDQRLADVSADPEYDADDLWEGVDYEGRDTRSGLPVTLNWEHNEGWSQNA